MGLHNEHYVSKLYGAEYMTFSTTYVATVLHVSFAKPVAVLQHSLDISDRNGAT
jgi:hypothetical protein